VLEDGRRPHTFGGSGLTSDCDDDPSILEALSVCAERAAVRGAGPVRVKPISSAPGASDPPPLGAHRLDYGAHDRPLPADTQDN
jgi:hypothetical protein